MKSYCTPFSFSSPELKKYFWPPYLRFFFFFLLDFFFLSSFSAFHSALHSTETSQNTDAGSLPSPLSKFNISTLHRRSLPSPPFSAVATASGLGFVPISASWVLAYGLGLCFTCCSSCCCWVLLAFTVYMLVDFGHWVCCCSLVEWWLLLGFGWWSGSPE